MEDLMKVNIIIDKKCNQHCKYCEHGNTVYAERTDEEIYCAFDSAMSKLEELFGKGQFRPQLQGGEPTILSRGLIHRICERLNGYQEVLVFSNGYDRNSEFYTRGNFKAVTHIIDWYGFDISKFPILGNETLAFCITHDEIGRVESLLAMGDKDIKILLLPCWSDNPAWNCTREDKSYLKRLEMEYHGESIPENGVNSQCSSMRIPLVDCTRMNITPCGFVPAPEPIETCTKESLDSKICGGSENEDYRPPRKPVYVSGCHA